LLWEFRCIIDVLLEGIMGLMVAAISLQSSNAFKVWLDL